ncbi:hypothetical protein BD324DRAFT_145390 [Kockovaella imperatae]|uniref:C2H2-type domain-containing protein n=1 Tax=Kockovaella imperatae TaxID=4999 RepID=A0A1Y1U8K7_9TREE|nr:hypothetical protein BD324DRAFT_145390 [Kockovaella imperatae]ORX34379.1 hypothetical protein BD324DRAFT_145390 [Kockovaella imperatae]
MATIANAAPLSFLSSLDKIHPAPPPAYTTFPSPPDSDVEFDIESFTHCSPEAPSITASSSTSIETSPRSSTTLGTPPAFSYPFGAGSLELDVNEPSTTDAIALSNHHFQRYLHYKALAAQAEEQAAAAASLQNEQIEAFLASISMPEKEDMSTNMMSSYQAFAPSFQPYSFSAPQPAATGTMPIVAPAASATAAMAHAQAQAHMQAHDAVLARAQHQRSLSMHSTASMQAPAMWSRTSTSTQSTTSPTFPTTPSFSAPIQMVPAAPMPNVEIITAAPLQPIPVKVQPTVATALASSVEGENELDSEADTDMGDSDVKPALTGLTNLHGGGRGYVPGKTPDDPKKRHKCQICGRGFARAFNLKSHVQTHNPMRSKPHQCPHASCKRGFSRLHDLERHRQGIHSDGPLVDAKRHGVAPAVARAQGRIQSRAENGSLV